MENKHNIIDYDNIDEIKYFITGQNQEILRLKEIIKEQRYSRDRIVKIEKLAALGRFTSDVAHEIRNPLTALGGFARRLLKSLPNESKEKNYANIIFSEVQRLEKILRDILSFSNNAKRKMSSCNINDILPIIVKNVNEFGFEQPINIECRLSEVPVIDIDVDQVTQAVENILTNAVNSMSLTGGVIKIISGTEVFNNVNYVVVSVTDEGMGISEEVLEKMFEPFYSTRLTGRGTGLGLSITKRIMEEHCGFVRAESTLGKGSIFKLYFPYQQPQQLAKTQCWEFMGCGVEKDAELKCPVYPHFGRSCWAIAGTFCEGKVQGTYAQKIHTCKHCSFYKKVLE